MADDPIVLDEHRGMAGQQATEIRWRLAEVKADQAALRWRRLRVGVFAEPLPRGLHVLVPCAGRDVAFLSSFGDCTRNNIPFWENIR